MSSPARRQGAVERNLRTSKMWDSRLAVWQQAVRTPALTQPEKSKRTSSLRASLLCSANVSLKWWYLPEAPSTPMFLVPQRNLLLRTSHPHSTCVYKVEKKRFWGCSKCGWFPTYPLSTRCSRICWQLLPACLRDSLPESFPWSLEQSWLMNRANQKSQGLNAP